MEKMNNKIRNHKNSCDENKLQSSSRNIRKMGFVVGIREKKSKLRGARNSLED